MDANFIKPEFQHQLGNKSTTETNPIPAQLAIFADGLAIDKLREMFVKFQNVEEQLKIMIRQARCKTKTPKRDTKTVSIRIGDNLKKKKKQKYITTKKLSDESNYRVCDGPQNSPPGPSHHNWENKVVL